MNEKLNKGQIPDGDPVINGQFPQYISPEMLHSFFEDKLADISDKSLIDYFELRKEEHKIIYNAMLSGWSNQVDDDLGEARKGIKEIEEQNPDIQHTFTELMNKIIDRHRPQKLPFIQ